MVLFDVTSDYVIVSLQTLSTPQNSIWWVLNQERKRNRTRPYGETGAKTRKPADLNFLVSDKSAPDQSQKKE